MFSVAEPVAAEGFAGTSLAPFKVAVNIMYGLTTGAGSFPLSQEINPAQKSSMPK